MKNLNAAGGWKDYSGVFALLLLSIFATELAIMEIFSPFFARLGVVPGGVLDALSMVLLCSLPMWFYIFRMLPVDADPAGNRRSWVLLGQVLGGIFLVEFLVMLILPVLCSEPDSLTGDLTDACLTTLLCSVPLWRLLFRPDLRARIIPMMDAPLRLYVLLLGSIFFSDLLQELLLHYRNPASIVTSSYVADAFLTTLFGAPLIWLLVARPLNLAARSEKARVTAVYAQVIDAIVVVDSAGTITSFNPAAERIFGFSAQEMLGESAAGLLEGGEAALGDLMTRGRTSEPANQPVTELSCRRRDARLLVMTASVSRLNLAAKPEFLLIMRDITNRRRMEEALRESEHRFRQIFHQSEDAIIFFRPGSCQVLDANAKAEKVFGYSKAQLQEDGFEAICASVDQLPLDRLIAETEKERVLRQDFGCRRKDGESIIVSLRCKTMPLQGEVVTYCSFRDITERVRMDERTREIHAKLIQTNKMTSLGLLVSGVAHEINNPNNFILANSELLERISEDTLKALDEYAPERGREGIYLGGVPLAEVGEQTRRLLGGIATGARRVNDIVSNLKGFARQEHNQPKREVDLNQVARSAVSLMHHELIKYTDRFHLELQENLPPILGHGQQLGQVIINLLMNACQALPGKGSGIWLSTACDADSGLVRVTVRDEGQGMSPGDSQRVLEPFFTTKLDCGGTGLGLSISDSIVKEHGGTLEFTSRAGEGTSFVVSLPVAGQPTKEQQ